MDCINFADGTNQWWALVEKGMNFFVPWKMGVFLTTWATEEEILHEVTSLAHI